MKNKQAILDLWQEAEFAGIAGTFYLVYGHAIGSQRYRETQDAFSREDAVRIVKSIDHLVRDTPDNIAQHLLHSPHTIAAIRSHTHDDDYPADSRVATADRDPAINMYSEQVTEANALQDYAPHADAWSYAKLRDTLDD